MLLQDTGFSSSHSRSSGVATVIPLEAPKLDVHRSHLIQDKSTSLPWDPESGTLFSPGSARHLSRLILAALGTKTRRLRCLTQPGLKSVPRSGSHEISFFLYVIYSRNLSLLTLSQSYCL